MALRDNPSVIELDCAKRAADLVTIHMLAGKAGEWVAIRLSDGGSDGVTYHDQPSAVKHQLHWTQCAYIRIAWDGMTQMEALAFLRFSRRAYDAGFRLPDPESSKRTLIAPLRRY